MPNLPSANQTINSAAGTLAGVSDYAVIMAPVGQSPDGVPRVFSSVQDILNQYNYSQGADYAAIHFEETNKPVVFIGLPIVTAGVLGRLNTSGVTGTSAVSVAAGPLGYLEETNCSLTVLNGGTIGTNGITFNLSVDGGWTVKKIRLGTANSYTVPFLGIVISFGAGTLVANDTVTFTTTAPLWDQTGIQTARTNLAAQQKVERSWVVIGDMPNSTFAGYVTTQIDAYETTNKRYKYARTSVRDRLPLSQMSQIKKQMTGAPNITFAAAGHTVTRSAGSFITDGFAVNDMFTVAGSTSNNGTFQIASLTDLVITLAAGLVNEGPISNVTIIGSMAITFAAAGHTITRTAGSWLNDGFAVGDVVTITGTASNNTTQTVATVTTTVLTFAAGLANEGPSRSDLVTVIAGETLGAWISAMDTAFQSVDAEKRIDISAGRARRQSPISGWTFRRAASWAASVREYTHDVQIPCWRKSDGPLQNWDITDGNGHVIEFDERVNGGALAARFTCFRTWGNGPEGTFIALSLTRDLEGSLLSRTHNLAVANIGCSVIQSETEGAIGQVLVLNDDGTATTDSLQKIEQRVNTQLQIALLQQGPEGQRASSATWTANKTDILNVPGATLNGTFALVENGTLEQINTATVIS